MNNRVPGDFTKRLPEVFDYFNRQLFSGRLPECAFMTLELDRGAGGRAGTDAVEVCEFKDMGASAETVVKLEKRYVIKLDFDHIDAITFQDALSTFVHEMCHVEEFAFGPNERVHNEWWATSMKGVGLIPSTTGEPGGQQVNNRPTDMSHYIEEGGRFDVVSRSLMRSWYPY